MKKNLIHLLLIALLMATLAACNDAPGDSPNPSTPENGTAVNDMAQKPDFAGQTLSISVTDLTYFELLNYVEKFKAAYPGVEIVLNRNRNDIKEWYKYGQQVGTQLMAGDADDIIDADGLDIRKISERGLLADFYPLMQNDPDFHEKDYYMNVFDAMAYNGKLTIFPTSFYYYVVGINNQFSDQVAEQFNSYETVTGRQLLDLYNNLENRDGRYLCCAGDSQVVFYDGVFSFIDFENKKCYFNTPEFIQFLTDFKSSTSSKISAHYKKESFDSSPDLANPGILEEYALQYLFQPFYEFNYRQYLMFLPEAQKEIFTHFIPYTTDANELIISENYTYCINEASENKELAWEFLKFITTPEANENVLLTSMPVNREVVKAFTPSNIAFFINQFQGAGMTIEGEAADVVTQVMAMLEPYHEMPMKCYLLGGTGDNRLDRDGTFYKNDLIAFFDGVLTAEQAASAIQSKVSLYLME